MAFGSTNDAFLTIGHDKTARVWDIKSGDIKILDQDHNLCRVCDGSADGKYWITGRREGERLMLWSATTLEIIAEQDFTDEDLSGAVFTPDSRYAIVGCGGQGANIAILSLPSLKEIVRLNACLCTYDRRAFCNQGKTMITAFWPELHFWDLDDLVKAKK
jgi:WD40 repeat protein